MAKTIDYKKSGVDVGEGYKAVDEYKKSAAKTAIPGLLTGIGSFNGMFAVPKHIKEPVMVSGTDGVGTKLDIAFKMKKYDTVAFFSRLHRLRFARCEDRGQNRRRNRRRL